MDVRGNKVDNVKKIAILRANALGDFIVTLPALKAIRTTYPNAEIVLLGKQWHKEFVIRGRSPVDRVVVVPVKKGIRTEAHQQENNDEIAAFVHQMQQENFDIVINFQGNGISANPFIKRFGAKLTAGLCSQSAEKLDRNLDYYYYQSEALRFLEVARLIGAVSTEIEPEVNVLKEDMDEIDKIMSSLEDRPYVVIHPIATDIRRMWPLENYPELANELKQRNIEVVFTGSAEDRLAVEDIIDKMSYTPISVCGKFSLGGLAALLSKAALVISPDTGPLHLARAVNTSTVGMYWAPNLINWGPLTRANHRPIISWNMACPMCGTVPNDPYPFEPRTECDHEVSFVRDITVEQVVQAAEALLLPKKMSKNDRAFVHTKAAGTELMKEA